MIVVGGRVSKILPISFIHRVSGRHSKAVGEDNFGGFLERFGGPTLCAQVEAKRDVIAEAIRRRGGQIHDELSFVFSVFEHGYGVVERNSGLQIILGQ
jgi:hypothetical protein